MESTPGPTDLCELFRDFHLAEDSRSAKQSFDRGLRQLAGEMSQVMQPMSCSGQSWLSITEVGIKNCQLAIRSDEYYMPHGQHNPLVIKTVGITKEAGWSQSISLIKKDSKTSVCGPSEIEGQEMTWT